MVHDIESYVADDTHQENQKPAPLCVPRSSEALGQIVSLENAIDRVVS